MTIVDFVALLFGVVLIASGIYVVIKKHFRGGSEYEEKDYYGLKAVFFAVIWICIGIALVYVMLYEDAETKKWLLEIVLS